VRADLERRVARF
jgi:hypothetical protein